jgi:LAS superfamily LD-carboxypeptidase LdcB
MNLIPDKQNILKFLPRVIFLFLTIFLMAYSVNISVEYEDIEYKKEQEIKKVEAEKRLYLTGKFDPSTKEGFILVPPENTFGGSPMYLLKEVSDAFILMREAAKKDGVDLRIASATRNFEDQKNIWNEQWEQMPVSDEQKLTENIPEELRRFRKILEFRSAPGTSRHHFGTDLDINRINPMFSEGKNDLAVRENIYKWLTKNARDFGFCQTYTPKGIRGRETGYNEERWHWSYIPLSRNFTAEYKRLIRPEDISGFLGDQYVASEDIINKYALSINPECL